MNTNRLSTLALAVATVLGSSAAVAEDAAAPDTSKWACKRCPFDKEYRANAELGALYVTEDSAKFGDYTGLSEKGGYVIADAEGKSTGESGYSLEYSLEDLGLDSRSGIIEGGKQGSYDFFLSYDAIPKYRYDTAYTPYLGTGSNSLSLPDDWVGGDTTREMTTLSSSLRQVDVKHDRETWGIGGRFFAAENWKFALAFHREDRQGKGIASGSFIYKGAQLHKPIDYTTDRVDASARYSADTWHLELAYFASQFDNKSSSLYWDNPFTVSGDARDAGQIALEPDNDFQQILVSGSKRFGHHTVLTGTFSTGTGSQNQSFLPYTVNSALQIDPLPASNLDGDVETTHYDIGVTSRPTSLRKLKLKAWWKYDERDNSSRTELFTTPVLNDSWVDSQYVNPQYSFERTRFHASAEYDVLDDLGLAIGADFGQLDRTDLAVKSQDETDGWLRAHWRPMDGMLDLRATIGKESRDPDNYRADLADGQNPLMRKYNMADRERSYFDFYGSWSHREIPVSVGLGARYADDDYDKSQLGLLSGSDSRVSGDVSYMFNERNTGYLHFGFEGIEAKQSNSEFYSAADWRAKREDDFVTAGLGWKSEAIVNNLDLEIDYTYARSEGKTKLDSDARELGRLPDLETELNSLRMELTYHLNERLDLLFGWWWEKFDSKDWSLQGVQPGTMASYVAFGADPYEYDVNVFSLSGRYSFGPRAAAGEDATE